MTKTNDCKTWTYKENRLMKYKTTNTDYMLDNVSNVTDIVNNAGIGKSLLDDNNNGVEPDVFFYHSDHLGSASWITERHGDAVQHLQYLPYGERYIDQHPFGYSERFTFTGKELDEETGYGYFGARYYDATLLTGWTAVDPMSDKYPSLSPYNYCAWNPVKLVDPDGRELYIPGITSNNHKQSKIDILSLVLKKNQGRVSFDADGKVSIDFSGLSGKEIDKLLYKDKGLALLDKMVVAEEKMLYECSDEYIDENGTTHNMIEQPDGIVNASNNGTDSKGAYTHTPAQGFDGHVVLAKSGRWERKQGDNWVNNKTSLLYHELDENYYRTVCGNDYKAAHDFAKTDEGLHYGNYYPGTFFSQGDRNRYSYKGMQATWCMPK